MYIHNNTHTYASKFTQTTNTNKKTKNLTYIHDCPSKSEKTTDSALLLSLVMIHYNVEWFLDKDLFYYYSIQARTYECLKTYRDVSTYDAQIISLTPARNQKSQSFFTLISYRVTDRSGKNYCDFVSDNKASGSKQQSFKSFQKANQTAVLSEKY